jgi:peptidoglycan hydrolase CwlO-like protein
VSESHVNLERLKDECSSKDAKIETLTKEMQQFEYKIKLKQKEIDKRVSELVEV